MTTYDSLVSLIYLKKEIELKGFCALFSKTQCWHANTSSPGFSILCLYFMCFFSAAKSANSVLHLSHLPPYCFWADTSTFEARCCIVVGASEVCLASDFLRGIWGLKFIISFSGVVLTTEPAVHFPQDVFWITAFCLNFLPHWEQEATVLQLVDFFLWLFMCFVK